jgi:hypothetical protein
VQDCLEDLDALGLNPEVTGLFVRANAERVFALTREMMELANSKRDDEPYWARSVGAFTLDVHTRTIHRNYLRRSAP